MLDKHKWDGSDWENWASINEYASAFKAAKEHANANSKIANNQAEYNAILIMRRYLDASISFDDALMALWKNLAEYPIIMKKQ